MRFRSPLLSESRFLYFPPGTEMVHFPGFARTRLWIHRAVHGFYPCGFPHSEIPGSMPACGSPRLIAACHVLHRLEVPRHPPCALSSLTIKFTHEQQISDLKFRISDSKTSSPEKILFLFLLLYCACTVKLALCVSFILTARLKSQISNFRSEILLRVV